MMTHWIFRRSGSNKEKQFAKQHRSRTEIFYRAAIFAGFMASPLISAAAPGSKVLRGHVPEIVRQLEAQGKLPAEQQLQLSIGLPLSNETGLSNFLERVYDPSDKAFGRYLTVGEFAQKFGASLAQYEQVAAFANKNHLAITARHLNRMVLDVKGSAADIERAFNVTLKKYAHPTENREFYAPDSEPVVDAELPILDVSGLDDYVRPQPKSVRMNQPVQDGPVMHAGSGPAGTYLGKDLRGAYLADGTLTGAGQILGLLQFDGFYGSDIAAFEKTAGLPAVPIQTVLLDGYDGVPTTGADSGNAEVSLDIEMALSMAPGLDKIIVFEAGPNGLPIDLLSSMASHTEVKQFSCSWGWSGGPNRTTDNLFKQMAAQGQSFFSASGDSDAFLTGEADDPSQANAPSSSPYITVVGGTKLQLSASAWSGESVWNRGGGVGSSGGISSHYSLPAWQTGIDLSAAGGSAIYRNSPDIAGVAENVYVTYGNGTNGAFGGTSCAAPMWAGLAALMNQRALTTRGTSIGFINPAIYALAKTGTYSQAFHDITSGNNTSSSSPNSFYATPGYDLCTGLGSPGAGLVDALAGTKNITVSPVPPVGFSITGRSDGSVQLGWMSTRGLHYQPQYAEELLNSPWLNLGNSLTGTGNSLSVTDPGAATGGKQRFYRLVVSP